jgi:rhodanese-related sulfurtransferase
MRHLYRLLVGVGLAFGVAQLATAADAPLKIDGATTVNADAVIDLVRSRADLVVIDTRTTADFDAGHIEDAQHLCDTDMPDEAALAKLVASKDAPVLFYCNGVTCGRAANASARAVSWGYTKVYYYALGLAEWKGRGLPLVR